MAGKATGAPRVDGTPAKKPGRSPHVPTAQQREQVKAMAGYGLPHDMIATIMGISDRTLQKKYRDELKLGSALATATIAKTLYQRAQNGDLGAAIFWLKARAGWREKQVIQHEGGDKPIEIKSLAAELEARRRKAEERS